jgi:hypothetical protein
VGTKLLAICLLITPKNSLTFSSPKPFLKKKGKAISITGCGDP